ncbi:MAG TPA: hypothetical protein DDZ42_17830 [Candidatus Rokubacteria bacterium]|nr:MAG: hypothetical protein A2050_15675 [Candidatus Rokubacteria bacterium GWA2_73_35]HBH03749.1 hypothetical protein [Candidatus Rokubacteria bacterium]
MTPARLEPEWEPRLVEGAVLLAVAGRAEEARFRAERDRLYGIAEGAERETAFDTLHAAWFARLGLDRPFREALEERPAIVARCARWLVAWARRRGDEGADLLVPPGASPTLLVRVTCETVAAPARLGVLLRRELLHVADMLDPRFGYAPGVPADVAGGPREHLVRENYRVLWNAYVDGRLARRGCLPAGSRAERLREFARAYAYLGEAAESAFARFFDADQRSHADLMAFAVGGPEAAPRPRCGLCDLPGPVVVAGATLAGRALAAIVRDFPAWRPADGVCARCAELYASRAAASA